MARSCLEAVMGTAGLYNTAGFDGETRASAPVPARHDVWRRVTCDRLAGMAARGVIGDEDAPEMAYEFACELAGRAYGLEAAHGREGAR